MVDSVTLATYMTAGEQMDTITAAVLQEQAGQSTVILPNGDTVYLVNKMTVGDAMIAAGLFLLLTFNVLKWLLDTVWKRG